MSAKTHIKSVILAVLFTILVLASTILTFYKYIILEDIKFETDDETFQISLLEEE